MQRAKLGALLTAGLTLIYLVVLGQFGIAMLGSATIIGKSMGLLVLVFPVLGIWALIREFRFGSQVERLSKRVEAEGVWPSFDLELRPSGRPIRASADRVFEEYKAKAEAKPEDWHSWFNLSLAYDAAGDRPRARKAMQQAIKLSSE
ncbi:MAG: tetratricopeptide repeat protein [Rhodoluna sp.]|nr:tetratricopeptide repeat protein [Rhodoluna sp.]